jgi:hypothetical protein
MIEDAQALRPSSMTEIWPERSPVAVVAAACLSLLMTGLLALIWTIIHSPDPKRRETDITLFRLVPPTPPQPRPKPARDTARKPSEAPRPIPVPPRKPVQQRRDSAVNAPAPKPKPAPPQPKTRSPSVADPLSLDAPPDWHQYALPQGPNAGTMIGGNGNNGGGSGCGGADAFLPFVISQIRTVFSRDRQMDSQTFHIQAQLWFNDLGIVQRSQLLPSTGKAALDASIRSLLGKIDIGRGMPQCVQPITVWINQPQDGKAMPASTYTESWQSRSRTRN